MTYGIKGLKKLMVPVFTTGLMAMVVLVISNMFTGAEGRLNNHFILWFTPLMGILIAMLVKLSMKYLFEVISDDDLYFVGLCGSVLLSILASGLFTYLAQIALETSLFFKDNSVSLGLKALGAIIYTLCLTVIYFIIGSEKTLWTRNDKSPKALKLNKDEKTIIKELSKHEEFTSRLILTIKKYGIGNYEEDLWIYIKALESYNLASSTKKLDLECLAVNFADSIKNNNERYIDEEIDSLLENINLDK